MTGIIHLPTEWSHAGLPALPPLQYVNSIELAHRAVQAPLQCTALPRPALFIPRSALSTFTQYQSNIFVPVKSDFVASVGEDEWNGCGR